MRLLLIRHGQTQSNVDHLLDTAFPGAPLDELGQEQAQDLVAALEDEPIDAIYASTLTRAQETAAPLAKARGLEVQVIDGIQEISAGVEEMNADWTNYTNELANWSFENMDSKLEEGESAREFLSRFDGAIADIEATGARHVAMVSHGAAMRVWGITQSRGTVDVHLMAPLRNTEWIVFEGSVADGWTIERWGKTLI